MRCAWEELLNLLPMWMRQPVDRQGRDTLQEIRLRRGRPPELVSRAGSMWLERQAEETDLRFVINAASRYSPWASSSVGQGYLTAPGGHRVGVCGEAVVQENGITAIREYHSLCLRIARDVPDIARGLALDRSLLILGSPGTGKTTLLRDLVRMRSNRIPGAVVVVDERGELFPVGFDCGKRTDVLTLCPKPQGIEMALRTMGPACIAVDEITSERDCDALVQAGWCGVHVLATVHASSRRDLERRQIYRHVLECGLFEELVILQKDKSWRTERI